MGTTDAVIASTVIITGTTLIRNAENKQFHFSTIVFGFLLTIVLLILSVAFPTFVKGLAYMGMVGAFAVNGPAIFKLVEGMSK